MCDGWLPRRFVVTILLLAVSAVFQAGPCAAVHLEDTTDVAQLEVPGVEGVNATHAYLSTTVDKLSRRIDRFFGEERIYQEASGTYVQVRGSLIYGRGGEFDFIGRFRGKVDLPQLEEKVHLVIEGDDSRDSVEAFNRITPGIETVDPLRDSDISAALQFVIREKERWSLSLRPGVKLSTPIESFLRLRFRRAQPLGKIWLSRGTVEAGFYSVRGWRNEWQLDLERALSEKDFFRASTTVLWREEDPGNQLLGQSFLVTHLIDRRQSIAYEAGARAETRPHPRDTSYFSSIRYRRDLHRGWLFLELKPQLVFARENSFKADPALVLTLETLLGAEYVD